jgi:hypothetical protein
LLGRVVLPLMIVYAPLLSITGFLGAKLVAFLDKRCGRASAVTFLVTFAIGVSALLTVIKAIREV